MVYTKICILFLTDFENNFLRNKYFDDTDCKNAFKNKINYRISEAMVFLKQMMITR